MEDSASVYKRRVKCTAVAQTKWRHLSVRLWLKSGFVGDELLSSNAKGHERQIRGG